MKSPDVAMQDMEAKPPHVKGNPAPVSPQQKQSALATFQAEQNLKIETRQLDDLPNEEKVPNAPPSSTGKKRRRRMASQIDRKFSCQFPGCNKAYGTESSLTQHQRIKHPQEDEDNKKQVGTFLLPLQHSLSMPTVSTGFETPPTPRTVSIRPAAMPLKFRADPISNQSTNDQPPSPSDIEPPSAKSQKSQTQNLRLRSNSLPVTSTPAEVTKVGASSSSAKNLTVVKPRPRAKKPRRAGTPHPKKTAARRTKSRSKSESLSDISPLEESKIQVSELNMPRSARSISDSTASIHDGVIPTSGSSLEGRGSFEWPPTAISAGEQPPTTASSDDQAIDSDILSVLASCDASELEDPAGLDFSSGGPPSFQSSTSFGDEDADMLPVGMECFKITENVPTGVSDGVGGGVAEQSETEPAVGLSAFATLDDDWANMHLAHHMQRMSFAQGGASPHGLNSTIDRLTLDEDGIHTAALLRSASDSSFSTSHMSSVNSGNPFSTMYGIGQFPSVPFPENNDIGQHQSDQHAVQVQSNVSSQQWHSGATSSEAVKTENNNIQQLFWIPNETGMPAMLETDNQQPSSELLDEMLRSASPQHEDTLEWKENTFSSTNVFQGDAFEGDGGIDYGLHDPGLASALVCQQEEL